jgi:type II secretory pathway predicted ATPase ExeA
MGQLETFINPFRAGSGQPPPYLAGRLDEQEELLRFLRQATVTENLILTGVSGAGKTVLLDSMKPYAQAEGWLWAGTDLSRLAGVAEEKLAERLIAALSIATRAIQVNIYMQESIGIPAERIEPGLQLGHDRLMAEYRATPGMPADKLKAALRFFAPYFGRTGRRGMLFAIDEAQNLSAHGALGQASMALLLDTFQSLQGQNIPFQLVLAGLPSLLPQLTEARKNAQEMFRVVALKPLSEQESRDAVMKPLANAPPPSPFSDAAAASIVKHAGGIPYFLQFMAREAFDLWNQRLSRDERLHIPAEEIVRKLDHEFFAPRWAGVTGRQRELLEVIAGLATAEAEFTIQDILAKSQAAPSEPFGRSHVNQLLTSLTHQGLVYKDRHGKYRFAAPMMAGFIRRRMGRG